MTNGEVTVISGRAEEARIEGTAAAVINKDEGSGERAQLFAGSDAQDLRSRWERIQGSFVDEPRKAVQQADALVDETVKRLSTLFSQERDRLEEAWERKDNVSTEDLRIALRRYRSFFDRMLAL